MRHEARHLGLKAAHHHRLGGHLLVIGEHGGPGAHRCDLAIRVGPDVGATGVVDEGGDELLRALPK